MPIKINYDLCSNCKNCYNLCPHEVYTYDEEQERVVVSYPEDCGYEGICVLECPREGAIEITLPLVCL
jgi:NAD-dependent dihydropyrimidine dehydrogenase PreA subunit